MLRDAFAALLLLLAAFPARAEDEQGVADTPHFLSLADWMNLTPDERRIFAMGVFDGFLFGMEARKAGWTLEWLDKCLETLTSGQLRDQADLVAANSASVKIGEVTMAESTAAASSIYSALVGVCKPQDAPEGGSP